jgi:peptide chain release factor
MKTLLQISAMQGPVECCLAVALLFEKIIKEAEQQHITTSIVERTQGPQAATYKSILIQLECKNEESQLALHRCVLNDFISSWLGVILWRQASSFRLQHPRKNWFILVQKFDFPELIPNSEIIYQTIRSSGPGGQHVNKTETAVRATHIATGISVKVQTERSQLANKKLANLLITQKLNEMQDLKVKGDKAQRRLQHFQNLRGNPIRTFLGEKFLEG